MNTNEKVSLRRRVLIIDRDPVIRILLGRMLKSMECEVVKALNGKHALGILSHEPRFDLVLIDYMIPEINALHQFFAEEGRYSGEATLPKVVVTAYDNIDLIGERTNKKPGEFLIRKPFVRGVVRRQMEDLFHLIERERGAENTDQRKSAEEGETLRRLPSRQFFQPEPEEADYREELSKNVAYELQHFLQVATVFLSFHKAVAEEEGNRSRYGNGGGVKRELHEAMNDLVYFQRRMESVIYKLNCSHETIQVKGSSTMMLTSSSSTTYS